MLFNLLILKHFVSLNYSLKDFIIVIMIANIITIIIVVLIISFIKIKSASLMINLFIIFGLLFSIYLIFIFELLQLELRLKKLFFITIAKMLLIVKLRVKYFLLFYLKVFTMKISQHIKSFI